MKRISSIVTIAVLALVVLSGCIKNKDIVWEGAVVEWDLASYQAKPAGLPFPLLSNIPLVFGRAVQSGDPTSSRTYTQDIRLRVNLVGRPRTTDLQIPVVVNTTYTTAVSGVHFQLLDNVCTIPRDSSFGYVRWRILNPGPPAPGQTNPRVIFELKGSGDVKPSENFKMIGWNLIQ
ncbi:MAG: hypothetical protein ACK4E8_04660 [Lacibacter sp.]